MAETNDTAVYFKGPWERFYPCKAGCGYVGHEYAWYTGECYKPCPRCGADRHDPRTGRILYKKVPLRFLPFIKIKRRVSVEWQEETKPL